MAAKTQIIATTRRFWRAMRTSRSIIEQYCALDDDALTGLQAMRDDDLILLLEIDVHRARLECPGRNLDEDLIGLVSQHHGRRRDDPYRLLRGHERGAGEHVRLQPHVRVWKRDADLGAARVRIQNVADEEDPALEDFAGIGSKDNVDGLTPRHQGGVFLWDVRRDPD